MTTKMQAAVVEQFGKPLVLQEWDIPAPGPGQILVKTEACGVCHTDLHAANGDWPLKPTLPFIPGHEAHRPRRRRSGGRHDRQGRRPRRRAVALFGLRPLRILPGGLGDGVRRSAVRRLHEERRLRRIHPGRPELCRPHPRRSRPQEAAPLICAGITTYKGIKETEARPGEWVVISGVGGLGHLAIQYAKAMGLQVCAVDIDDGKLAHAKRLGADLVVNAKTGDPAAAVKKATGGGAHGVLITAPSLPRIQAGRRHDPQARHLRAGRAAAGRVPGAAVRCRGELHHRSAARSSARARTWPKRSPSPRGQGQGRYRAAAAVVDQRGVRHASRMAMCRRAWCSISSGTKADDHKSKAPASEKTGSSTDQLRACAGRRA